VRHGASLQHDDRRVHLQRELVPERLLQRRRVRPLRVGVADAVRDRWRSLRVVQQRPLRHDRG
jgi:hypothetical protein